MAERYQRDRPFTFDDWFALPESWERIEVLAGEVVITPTPVVLHQHVVGELMFRLYDVLEKARLGTVYSYLGVRLSHFDVVIPDVLVVLAQNHSRLHEFGVYGPPDLIVEVSSADTSRNDRIRKRATYATFGVLEYWIADPDRQSIEAFTLVDGRYEPLRSDDGLVRSKAIEGLVIDPEPIFAKQSWMPVRS